MTRLQTWQWSGKTGNVRSGGLIFVGSTHLRHLGETVRTRTCAESAQRRCGGRAREDLGQEPGGAAWPSLLSRVPLRVNRQVTQREASLLGPGPCHEGLGGPRPPPTGGSEDWPDGG